MDDDFAWPGDYDNPSPLEDFFRTLNSELGRSNQPKEEGVVEEVVGTGDECPEGYIWVKKPGVVPTSNGCNFPPALTWLLPSGGTKDVPVPGISFLDACNAHDIAYCQCGGTRKKYTGKKSADDKFHFQMASACIHYLVTSKDTDTVSRYYECSFWAGIYAQGVRTFGWSPFKDAQDENCHCAPDPTPHPQTIQPSPPPPPPKTTGYYPAAPLYSSPGPCAEHKWKEHPESRPKD
jgi:hypothetical protein